MNTAPRTLLALILLSSASTAIASPERGGRGVAQIAAPDVSSWTEIADDLYQGVGRQGEAVTVSCRPAWHGDHAHRLGALQPELTADGLGRHSSPDLRRGTQRQATLLKQCSATDKPQQRRG